MIPKLIIFFAIGFVAVLPLNWRQCVKLVLFLVVCEGALRKWVIPGASDFIYFFKDYVILTAYYKYFSSPVASNLKRLPGEQTRRTLILLSAMFIAFEVANPASGSPILGAFGARNYLLYIPMMYLVGDLFRTREELIHFLQRYLLLTLPIAVLALKQSRSPAASAYNIYAWTEAVQPAMVGTLVRVTGTFSYIAGYASYLLTSIALVIPLLVLELPPIWRWTMRLVTVAIVASMLLTGSRGPIFGLAVMLALYFILNRVFRRLRLYHKFITPVVLCIIPFVLWFGPQINAYVERASGTQDLLPRTVDSVMAPFYSMKEVGFFGYGTGSAYQAADIIRAMFGLPSGEPITAFLESEPQRVMFELGPIGFFLWYFLRIHIVAALWRTHRMSRTPLYRELALTACLVHLLSLNGQMVFQITFMVYYWFLSGFIYLMPKLENREARAREETAATEAEAAAKRENEAS